MNKSILIVICDFIVLSMMTLILGLNGPQRSIGGTAEADSRAVAVLAEQLADRNAELEAARRQLTELRRNRPLTAEESAKLEDLTRELAQRKLAEAEQKKDESLTDTTRGELTAADLKKEVDALKMRNAVLELEKDSAGGDAEHYRKLAESAARNADAMKAELEKLRTQSLAAAQQLSESEKQRIAKEAELTAAAANLESAQAKLADTEKVSAETAKKLAESEQGREATKAELEAQLAALNKAKIELAKKHEELDLARSELTRAGETSGAYAEQVKQAQLQLSYTTGKLSSAEQELAEARGQLEKLRREATSKEILLAGAQKEVAGLQTLVKKSVSDLSVAKDEIKDLRTQTGELGQVREKAAALQGEVQARNAELASTREKLAAAQDALRSDVTSRYAETVRTLKLHLADRRTLADHVGNFTFYFPEVEIEGKRYLVGELLAMTDMADTNSPYSSVYELEYAVGPAESGKTELCYASALRAARFDPRVAMLEVAASTANPLHIIGASELKDRGIKDLYLYSKTARGTASAVLDSRVSIDGAAQPKFLTIRNNTARGASELRAAPGDFVLTKQGELAGVVVSVVNFNLGMKQEARVALFPDDFTAEKTQAISLEKPQGSEYYADFAAKMGALFPSATELTRAERDKK
ncbi:MAG: hypothetical protein VB042_01405 [Victivallaceae bacterium]|nr:hypothetical protein [Victivallaceae bacterium]